MEKQKVKITRNTVAAGRTVEVGDVLELEGEEARYLVGIGKAVPAGMQTREPAPSADEKPKAKASSKKARK